MMDPHFLKILEYDKVKELISNFTVSALGREKIQNTFPVNDKDLIEKWLGETTEMISILQLDELPSISGISDIRPSLELAAAEGAILEVNQIRNIASFLRCARALKGHFEKASDTLFHRLKTLTGDIVPLPELEKEVDTVLSPEGGIRDTASKELASIRKRIRSAGMLLENRLNESVMSFAQKGMLQIPRATIRNNRSVLPVKSQFRNRIKGIVHDRSASGETIYIEPLSTVELNNRIAELTLAETKEIQRILRSLTGHIGRNLTSIHRDVSILQDIDFIYGKACFSLELDCAGPDISSRGDLHLINARHPLLATYFRSRCDDDGQNRKEVIPLTISLGDRFDALVITGPNTGGKTVVLKTVGILQLMTQTGIPIPADSGSRLGVFDEVFADIGDEQSLESNLSTFSSHISNIVTILTRANDRSLVLLDELGAGTDPEEGIALAIEVIKTLLENRVKLLATTHFGAIKIFAQNQSRVENASMEFDPEQLIPTYTLRVGVPGSSYGITIAKKLGMPDHIAQEAATSLGDNRLKIESLIRTLEERVRKEEDSLRELEREREELKALKTAYSKNNDKLVARERELRKKAYKGVQEIIDTYRKQLEHTIAEIRKTTAEKESIKRARKKIDQLQSEAEHELSRTGESLQDDRAYWPDRGEEVWVEPAQSRGTVLRLDRKSGVVQIQINNMRIDISPDRIRPLTAKEKTRIPSTVSLQYESDGSIDPQIDLRGKRANEIPGCLDRYLDQALLSGLLSVRIIHGKGSGVLRKRVQELLRKDSRIDTFRLGEWNEGGDGVTIVSFPH
jgi:DNA mismatch repair protein MutS2